MRDRGRLSWRLGLVLWLIALLAACSHFSRSQSVFQDEMAALQRVDENSDWIFSPIKTSLEVQPDGVSVLTVEGNALPKSDTSGALWAPLLLVPELPAYYRLEGDSARPELEAYRLKNGLWILTAVLFDDPESDRRAPTGAAIDSKTPLPTTFRLTLYAPQYASTLPFLIPSPAGRSSLDLQVRLPKGSHFRATSVAARTVGQEIGAELVVLPPSLSTEAVAAAGALRVADRALWDLSGVTYEMGAPVRWRPWFPPAALLVVAVGVGLIVFSVTRERARWRRHMRGTAHKKRMRALSAQADQVDEMLMALKAQDQKGETREVLALVHERWPALRTALEHAVAAQEPKAFALSGRASSELAYLISELRTVTSLDQKVLSSVDEIASRLETFRSESSAATPRLELRERHTAPPLRAYLIAAMVAVVVALVVWLLSVAAAAQPAATAPRPTTGARTLVADLSVGIAPDYTRLQGNDVVTMTLGFVALTDSRKSRTADIAIDLGPGSPLRISNVAVPSVKDAQIQQTARSARVTVPVTFWSATKRLTALGDRLSNFDMTSYQQILDKAPRTTVTYAVTGTRVDHDFNAARWFHWFPLDDFTFSVPTAIDQFSLVSDVRFQLPSFEWATNPTVRGPLFELKREDQRARYDYRSPSDVANALWAGSSITVDAQFRRSSLQRFGLTLGLLVLSAVVGGICGWLTTLPDKSWQGGVIGAIGIVGVPWAIRTAALAGSTTLPNAAAWTGVTFFDAMFTLDVVLFAVSAFVIRKSV